MATAYYTVRVETNYGDWMEFEIDYDVDDDFDPKEDSDSAERDIYEAVMQNLYVDIDFVRMGL